MSEPKQLGEGFSTDRTLVKSKCRSCGVTEMEIEKMVVDMFGGASCDPCIAEHELRQAGDSVDQLTALFKSLVPPVYHYFDESKYPKESMEKLEEVKAWTYQSKGMYILGASRKGKTRALMELLRKLIITDMIKDITVFWAGDLKDKIVELGNDKKRTQFKDEVKKVRLLIMDDVFNDSMTESLASFVFSVIDYRLNHLMPTIITSNLNREELKAIEGEGTQRANALYERIRESCKAVWFK